MENHLPGRSIHLKLSPSFSARFALWFWEAVNKPLMPLAIGASDERACFQEYPLLFVSFRIWQRGKRDRTAILGDFCRKIIRWLPKLNIRKSMCILYDFIYVSMFKTSFPKLKLQCMHIINFKIIKGGHHPLPIPASLTRNNFPEVNSVWCFCIQHIYGSFSIPLTNGSIPHIPLCFLLYSPLTICLRVCQCQRKWINLVLFINAQYSIRGVCHDLFNPSYPDGHLGTANKTAWVSLYLQLCAHGRIYLWDKFLLGQPENQRVGAFLNAMAVARLW